MPFYNTLILFNTSYVITTIEHEDIHDQIIIGYPVHLFFDLWALRYT